VTQCLGKTDAACLPDALRTLAVLCDDSDGLQQAVAAGAVAAVVGALEKYVAGNAASPAAVWAAKALGRLALADGEAVAIAAGAAYLPPLVVSADVEVVRHTLFVLEVLAAQDDARPALGPGLVRALVERLHKVEALRSSAEEAASAVAGEDAAATLDDVARRAMSVFLHLAGEEGSGEAMVAAGVVPALLGHLDLARPGPMRAAMAVLLRLAIAAPGVAGPATREACPAVGALLGALGSPDADLAQQSMMLLAVISQDAAVGAAMREGGAVPLIMGFLDAPSPLRQQQALEICGNLCENSEAGSLAMLNCGGLMKVVALLSARAVVVQIAAVRALGYLASGGEKMAAAVLAVGCIDTLIALLASPLEDLRENSARALYYLSLSGLCRGPIVNARGVPAIVMVLGSDSPATQKYALRALQQLCEGDAAVRRQAVEAEALPQLVGLLSSPDEEVKALSSYTLMGFSRDDAENRGVVLNLGGIAAFVSLLQHHEKTIRHKAAEMLHVFCDEEAGREGLRGCSGVPVLVRALEQALETRDHSLAGNLTGALAHLTRDRGKGQLEELNDNGVLAAMLTALRAVDIDPMALASACFAVESFGHSPRCGRDLVDQGALTTLVPLLGRSEPVAARALAALHVLSTAPEIVSLCVALADGGLAAVIHFLSSPDLLAQEQARTIILNMCGESTERWDIFVDLAGLNALLVLAAAKDHPRARLVAARELSRLSNSSDYQAQLRGENASSYVIGLLLSADLQLECAILLAVRNIADDPNCAKALVTYGGLVVVCKYLDPGELALQLLATEILTRVARQHVTYGAAVVEMGIFPVLVEAVLSDAETNGVAAMRLIAVLVDGAEAIKAAHTAGAAIAALAHLGHPGADGGAVSSARHVLGAMIPLGIEKTLLMRAQGRFDAGTVRVLIKEGDAMTANAGMVATLILAEEPRWCTALFKSNGGGVLECLAGSLAGPNATLALRALVALLPYARAKDKAVLVQSAALERLQEALRSEDAAICGLAVGALSQLASLLELREALSSSVPALLGVLRGRHEESVQLSSLMALRYLLLNPICTQNFVDSGGVSVLLLVIHATKSRGTVLGIAQLLHTLQYNNKATEAFVSGGGVPIVMSFLSVQDPELLATFMLLIKGLCARPEHVQLLMGAKVVSVLGGALARSQQTWEVQHLCLEAFLHLVHHGADSFAAVRQQMQDPALGILPDSAVLTNLRLLLRD